MTSATAQRSYFVSSVIKRMLCAALALALPFACAAAQAEAIGAQTRFDFVAVFPLTATATQIESWRDQVLTQPHLKACVSGRPCVSRMMRMALANSAGREVIAFDLMRDAPAEERAAIIAAAQTELPGTALFTDTRPVDIGRTP